MRIRRERGQREYVYAMLSTNKIQKTKKPAVFRRRLWMRRKASVRVNLQSNHEVTRGGHYSYEIDSDCQQDE
jgi:hypothetical protein